jgi:hypothetical protein
VVVFILAACDRVIDRVGVFTVVLGALIVIFGSTFGTTFGGVCTFDWEAFTGLVFMTAELFSAEVASDGELDLAPASIKSLFPPEGVGFFSAVFVLAADEPSAGPFPHLTSSEEDDAGAPSFSVCPDEADVSALLLSGLVLLPPSLGGTTTPVPFPVRMGSIDI